MTSTPPPAQSQDSDQEKGQESGLGKGLKKRHMNLIALGGVIGAGLFVGSGVVIESAGP
ncbi:MAG: GABA permease, partial [Rhodococcus sp. (in: high G+C Gram-positive bacteria)]